MVQIWLNCIYLLAKHVFSLRNKKIGAQFSFPVFTKTKFCFSLMERKCTKNIVLKGIQNEKFTFHTLCT